MSMVVCDHAVQLKEMAYGIVWWECARTSEDPCPNKSCPLLKRRVDKWSCGSNVKIVGGVSQRSLIMQKNTSTIFVIENAAENGKKSNGVVA